MKQLLEEVKELFKNKLYIICLGLTLILGYGFTVTHTSIGVDDLCIDRYVSDSYILSAGRFGTWFLYNIFQIKEYSPFWLEAVVCIILFATAVILSAIIKVVSKNKLNRYSYIIVACIYISFPILAYFYSYQSTNFSIALSNLFMMLSAYGIYYNYIENKKLSSYIIPILITGLAISCYESCIQTFITMSIIIVFLHLKYVDKKQSFKKVVLFGMRFLAVLILSLILFLLISFSVKFILEQKGILRENGASIKTIFSLQKYEMYLHTRSAIFVLFLHDYNGTKIFAISIMIFSIITILDAIRDKEWKYILLSIILVLSNFIFMFLIVELLYRAYYSWAVLQAFQIIYIFEFVNSIKSNKTLEKILVIICAYLIFHQTYIINQLFYKEYIDSEASKRMALNIGNTIVSNIEDYKSKKIMFIRKEGTNWEEFDKLFVWSFDAFSENGVEICRYMNHLGFKFQNATQGEYEEFSEEYLQAEKIDNYVYNSEKYIFVVI